MNNLKITWDSGESMLSWDVENNGVYKTIRVSIPCLGDTEIPEKEYHLILEDLVKKAIQYSKMNDK